MATRWYLKPTYSTVLGRPAASEATAVGDEDNGDLTRLLCRVMDEDLPAGPATVAEWTAMQNLPITDPMWWLVGLWEGPALPTQTLSAGLSVTVTSAVSEQGEGGSNIHAAAYAYLRRPGQGNVACLTDPVPIIRTPILGGSELDGVDAPLCWREMTAVLGENIAVHARDRVVVELWAMTHDEFPDPPGHWRKVGWGGSTTYAEGEQADDPAAYIEFSDTLQGDDDMGVTVTDILVGARTVKVDSVDIGATIDGVSVEVTKERVEHIIDQVKLPVGVTEFAEAYRFRVTAAETDLDNLKIAMGQPATSLSTNGTKTTLAVGDHNDDVPTHALEFTGKAPGTDKTRTISIPKAYIVEGGSHAYTKNGVTVYEMTFGVLADTSQGAGFRAFTVSDDAGAFVFALS